MQKLRRHPPLGKKAPRILNPNLRDIHSDTPTPYLGKRKQIAPVTTTDFKYAHTRPERHLLANPRNIILPRSLSQLLEIPPSVTMPLLHKREFFS